MIGALVKNRLNALFGSIVGRGRRGAVKKASLGRIILLAVLYLYVFGVLATASVFVSIYLGRALIPIGASWLYFAVFSTASFTLTFIFGIFETKSELFECKDNELLLSMPIKPRDIVGARFCVLMIYNYLEQLFIMLPSIIVYAVYSGDVIGVIGAIIVTLFIPFFSTAFASVFGYLLALVSKKIGKNSFVSVALSLIFIFAYIFGYNAAFNGVGRYFEELIASGVTPSDMPFFYHLGAASLMRGVQLPIFVLLTLIVGAACYLLISHSYVNIVTKSYASKKTVYKGEYIKERSPLSALISKELRKFFSSAIYMLNGGLGLILILGLGIFAIIKLDTLRGVADFVFADLGLDADGLSVVMIAALSAVLCTVMISTFSLSLEGNNLWILKTLPLKDGEILLSKLLPQMIVSTPPTLIASILLAVAAGAGAEYWFFYLATPFLVNLFYSAFGLIINVLFPKFDFVNEAQVIKQSLASFIVVMTQMLLSLVFAFGSFALLYVMPPVAVAALGLAFFALLTLVCFILLFGPVKRRFSRIEV